MKRYWTLARGTDWAVVDRCSAATTLTERPLSRPAACDLAELLNSLEDQESWRREAVRWPQAVA